MNDMYSEREMPTFMERKKDLLEYAKKNGINSDFLDSAVIKIVSETLDYSYTWYYAFGRDQERSKLRKEFGMSLLYDINNDQLKTIKNTFTPTGNGNIDKKRGESYGKAVGATSDNATIMGIAASQGWNAAFKEMLGDGSMSYAEMRSRFG